MGVGWDRVEEGHRDGWEAKVQGKIGRVESAQANLLPPAGRRLICRSAQGECEFISLGSRYSGISNLRDAEDAGALKRSKGTRATVPAQWICLVLRDM